jgi:cyclohexanone monooxygenase
MRDFEFDIIVLATGFKAYTRCARGVPDHRRDRADPEREVADRLGQYHGCRRCGLPQHVRRDRAGHRREFANLPTSIEQNAIWITACIRKMEHEGYATFWPKAKAEAAWTKQTADIHAQTLMAQGDKVNSWMMGANRADKGARVLIYFGGLSNFYYDALDQSAASGFPNSNSASNHREARRPTHVGRRAEAALR